jgi:hypothetical protein
LQALGVAQVCYPRLLSSAAVKGVMNALDVFVSDVIGKDMVGDGPDLLVSFEELNDLVGMKFLDELETRYATP